MVAYSRVDGRQVVPNRRCSMDHQEPKVKSLVKAMNILSCFTVKEPV